MVDMKKTNKINNFYRVLGAQAIGVALMLLTPSLSAHASPSANEVLEEVQSFLNVERNKTVKLRGVTLDQETPCNFEFSSRDDRAYAELSFPIIVTIPPAPPEERGKSIVGSINLNTETRVIGSEATDTSFTVLVKNRYWEDVDGEMKSFVKKELLTLSKGSDGKRSVSIGSAAGNRRVRNTVTCVFEAN